MRPQDAVDETGGTGPLEDAVDATDLADVGPHVDRQREGPQRPHLLFANVSLAPLGRTV
jgi:hypothetical protein